MSDTLEEAQCLYRESLDACREQRQQMVEDFEFSDPSNPNQWDAATRLQRENDPGGRRPCLVMDHTSQYVQQVSGQVEQNPPAVHAIPVGGGADKQAAEQIDGRFRHIEHASRASQHYARALTSAARAGVGYLIVRPDYVNRALNWQEPRISSEPNPLNVVCDPWSTETDGSDMSFGFLLTPYSVREFERRWPGKDAADFGDPETAKRDDTRKSVIIAEQWCKESSTTEVIVYQGADGQETSGDADQYEADSMAAQMQLPVVRKYKDKTEKVLWRRMSGADVLEESEYLASSIGIIPVYGYVGFIDGRMKYCGIPRRARNPQQAYNYHKSELLMPGGQLLASKRALAGLETIWDRAQVQRRAFLPWNDQDEDGPVSPPSLIKVGSQLVDHAAGAESALRDIQAAVAMFQANLGAPSNETSGVAIESRKQQGEAGNAHFPSHLAASLGQVGNIVMQMDARLSDTRRKQPIMGIDGTSGHIYVDPDQREAYVKGQDGVSVNPTVGTYGVRVVIGASYSTQRTQTNAAFAEIMRGNPALAPVVAPFWAQTLDFPGSDKFAQAMAAMSPDPVKAILRPEGADNAPDPAKLAQELAQCKQALQEAIKHVHDAQQDADEAIAAKADAQRLAEVRERELDIQAYNAETNRLKVTGANEQQTQAIVRDLIEQMLSQPDPLPGDPESAQESQESPGMEQEPAEGQGPDGSAIHEGMEGEAPEPGDESMGMPPAMHEQGEVMQ